MSPRSNIVSSNSCYLQEGDHECGGPPAGLAPGQLDGVRVLVAPMNSRAGFALMSLTRVYAGAAGDFGD